MELILKHIKEVILSLIKKVPSGFGHEFSGTIAQIGDKVKNFRIGQKVVAANSAPCLDCYYCKKGEFNLCENLNLLNGAYAQYIKVSERITNQNLLEIPDNVSFEEAAFTEPLANVVHGVERSDITPSSYSGSGRTWTYRINVCQACKA